MPKSSFKFENHQSSFEIMIKCEIENANTSDINVTMKLRIYNFAAVGRSLGFQRRQL